jgi:hypothetical protein
MPIHSPSISRVFSLLVVLLMLTPTTRAGTIVLPEQDEELQNRRREQWLEEIHRAAPGTDWRMIADANREQLRLLLEGLTPENATLSGSWSELGADGVTGRTLCVAQSSVDASQLYVGTGLGGMWLGPALGGSALSPHTDALGIGVQQIVIVPRTGRDDFVLADGASMLYCSGNGGATWSVPTISPSLPYNFWNARRLVQDAASPTRVFALVDSWYWTGTKWEAHTFLLRSENGGAAFTVLRSDLLAPAVDIWMNRLAGGTLWLLAGNQLSRSTDHGASFTSISTLPAATPDQVSLVGSEAGAPKLYAALHTGSAWKLFSTANRGVSWQVRTAPSGWWGVLGACITDSAKVFVGGVECSRSTNGGTSFTRINAWGDYYGDPLHKLHADIRGIQSLIVPTGPGTTAERIYISTDGGTYLLSVGSATPTNLTLTGLRNAQYYSVRSNRTTPSRISVGSQDQGFQTTTSAPSFTQAISGDYGHLTSARSANDLVWATYPGFMMLQLTESPPTFEWPSSGTNFPSDPHIPWMPAILADPDHASQVIFGGRYLWRITRTASLTYTYANLRDFDAGNGDQVGVVAIAPTDHNRWYVATYQGRLYYSTNAGVSFTASASTGPSSHYFYGSDLLVSPTSRDTAYVCGSGLSGPAVYRTTDGGVTWNPYGTGMPATLAHRLAFDSAHRLLFAATEAGPFLCTGGKWLSLLTAVPGAPLTDYWDAEYVPSAGVVRFATYGRGLWDFQTASLVAVAPSSRELGVRLALHPNPSRSGVRLDFSQNEAGPVRIDVFDVTGRRRATPLDRWCAAGDGVARFDGRDADGRALQPGIYLVRIQARGGRDVRQLVMSR